MNKSETITKIASALVVAQKTMGNATKDAKNPFFKSTYADLNSIREAALPALNNQGIGVFQPTITVDGKNYVETVLMHVSGEWISGLTEIKNVKGDAQGEGSGISYSRRYGLQSLLNIGAVDDDGEAAVGRKNDKTQEHTGAVDNKTSVSGGVNKQVGKGSTGFGEQSVGATLPATVDTGKVKSKPLQELVTSAFKVLEAQKKITKEEFKTKYQKGVGLSTLSEPTLQFIYNSLKTDFPGLGL